MPWRCWPVFTKIEAPTPPPAAASTAAPPVHTAVGRGHIVRHHRHIWWHGAHKPAAAKAILVYAGVACAFVPGALALLGGPHPWTAGGVPTAPGAVVVGAPAIVGGPVIIGGPGIATTTGRIFPNIPAGIIGDQPAVNVPEPDSLTILATCLALMALGCAIYRLWRNGLAKTSAEGQE